MDGVLSLRKRDIPRPPRAPPRRRPATVSLAPLLTILPEEEEGSEPEFNDLSSSPPRLGPAAFGLNDVLNVAQLMSDVEWGRFSMTPSSSQQILSPLPYETPSWFALFVQHLLDMPIPIQSPPASPPTNAVLTRPAPPASARQLLSLRYTAELHILEALSGQGYGTAYIHYTRYRLLKHIASAAGLSIDKPSQTSSIDGVPLNYQDLFDWAQVNPGTFANVKPTIVNSERVRRELSRSQSTLNSPQRVLLGHLSALATDPSPHDGQVVALRWGLSELGRNMARCGSILPPAGPRRSTVVRISV
ncbi:hypothetical protein C8F04DRAFT_1152826 [Mycena alexandri]|uniref:Uncharacterized protein n=1 Tax=Mycena alexandri TaxID=1745969 RepID=A0AAD6WMI1_9AGAR|nr:hypothetical protein C8F04DRAFT_1152826 [Mycena alexandri]